MVYFFGGSVLDNTGTLPMANSANMYNYDSNAANQVINETGAT